MDEIKKQIKNNFSMAVKHYNKWAVSQRVSAEKLAMLLPKKEYVDVLDIGCGTGFVIEELRRQKVLYDKFTGIDVAPGMIKHCKTMWPDKEFICEDAEQFQSDKQYDLILSNFTFQWLKNPVIIIEKYLDALKKDGILALSFPVKGSLREIREAATHKNDQALSLLPFPDFIEILQTIHQTRKEKVLRRLVEPVKTMYENPKEAIKAIKKIGAGFLKGQSYSVKQMKNLLESYDELFKNEKGTYPSTYNVAFFVLQKQK